MKRNYIKELDTFIFRRSWGDVFKQLSNEEAGMIIKAIYQYADGEEATPEVPADTVLASIFQMIITQLNYSSRKHYMHLKNGFTGDSK